MLCYVSTAQQPSQITYSPTEEGRKGVVVFVILPEKASKVRNSGGGFFLLCMPMKGFLEGSEGSITRRE